MEEFSNADSKNNHVNGRGDVGEKYIGEDGEQMVGKNDGEELVGESGDKEREEAKAIN